jgi:hypothetical protein
MMAQSCRYTLISEGREKGRHGIDGLGRLITGREVRRIWEGRMRVRRERETGERHT